MAAAEVVAVTPGKTVVVSSESVPAAKSATKNPSRTLDLIVEEEKEAKVNAIEYFSTEVEAPQASAAAAAKTKAEAKVEAKAEAVTVTATATATVA